MNAKIQIASMQELSPILLAMLDDGVDVTLTVTGNSMYPLWKDGRDQVVLTACRQTDLRKGQVALFQRTDGPFVLHRVVGVKNSSYAFLGDAQTQVERGIRSEQILAVVKSYTHKGKRHRTDGPWDKWYRALWRVGRPVRRYLLWAIRHWG